MPLERCRSWPNGPDSKSGEHSRVPRVRIPPSPPFNCLTVSHTFLFSVYNNQLALVIFFWLLRRSHRFAVSVGVFRNFHRRNTNAH